MFSPGEVGLNCSLHVESDARLWLKSLECFDSHTLHVWNVLPGICLHGPPQHHRVGVRQIVETYRSIRPGSM